MALRLVSTGADEAREPRDACGQYQGASLKSDCLAILVSALLLADLAEDGAPESRSGVYGSPEATGDQAKSL